MRVATYARFSSILQDRRSIVDQQRELHTYADLRGWTVVADFADEAASGESLHMIGRSARQIATNLNREGVKGPRGNTWGSSTILGNQRRGTGILHNVNYIGRIEYNRLEYRKNPATGRRQSRLNGKAQIHTKDIPALRIVDQESWDTVQGMQKLSGAAPLRQRRRPRRALSGLLACGECDASYIITQGEWCGCSAYKNRGTCSNKRMIRMDEIERRVFDALKTKLAAPDTVAAAIEAHRIEHDRLAKLRAKDKHAIEREIGDVNRRLARLMESIETGDGDLSELLSRQKELVAKRRELETRIPHKRKVVALHPDIAVRYKVMVDNIQVALARGDAHAHEAVQLVRSLITKIIVTPEANRMGLEVLGDLAVLMGARTDPESDNVCGGCGDRI